MALTARGIAKGDVISIVSENRIDYAVIYLAGFYLRAVLQPLNVNYQVCTYAYRACWRESKSYIFFFLGELRNVLDLSRPKLILASKDALQRVKNLQKQVDYVEMVIGIDTAENDVESYEDVIEAIDERSVEEFRSEICENDEEAAMLFCSSGTTGFPKSVIITHLNWNTCLTICG